MKTLITLILLVLATPAFAQRTIAWTAPPNITTAAEVSTFTWPLYVTPKGTTTAQPPINLTGVTCTGTTAPFACSTTTLPDCVGTATANCLPLSYDTKIELTAKSPLGVEGAKSTPFLSPPGVPMGLRVTP